MLRLLNDDCALHGRAVNPAFIAEGTCLLERLKVDARARQFRRLDLLAVEGALHGVWIATSPLPGDGRPDRDLQANRRELVIADGYFGEVTGRAAGIGRRAVAAAGGAGRRA